MIHGSGTEAAKAAAAEAVRDQAAAAQLEALVWRQDAPPVQSAVLELQLLAGQLRQALSVLGGRLNQSVVCPTCHRGPEPLDGPTARVWTTVVREQRQLLAAMEGLGLAERQVQVEQEKAQIVTAAFLGALGEVPGLLPVDRNLMLRGFLSRLGRGPDAITAGEVVPS